MIVSGPVCWDIGLVFAVLDLSFWSWAFGLASFSISPHDCFRTCMLGLWTCHGSVGLVFMKLGRFSTSNYGCFRTCISGRWTCHPSIGLVIVELDLRPSFILNTKSLCFWTWMLGHWTCHPSIGLVILKLGFRPRFILNIKLRMCLDLLVLTLVLSLQHWTCHLAGPSA